MRDTGTTSDDRWGYLRLIVIQSVAKLNPSGLMKIDGKELLRKLQASMQFLCIAVIPTQLQIGTNLQKTAIDLSKIVCTVA